MRRTLLFLLAPLAASVAQTTPAKRAFTPNDWYRVAQLAGRLRQWFTYWLITQPQAATPAK